MKEHKKCCFKNDYILAIKKLLTTQELFILSRFYISAYSQSACGQLAALSANNPADSYRMACYEKNYPKGSSRIKAGAGIERSINQ